MNRLRGSFSSRSTSFNADSLGHDAVRLIGNLSFAFFVLAVLVITIIAATYQPDDPLLRPTDKLTSFLTSHSNATFRTDSSTIRTGEDFILMPSISAEPFINITDIAVVQPTEELRPNSTQLEDHVCEPTVDCSDRDLFNLMMRAAIEAFKDVHFYRFGKPTPGGSPSSCDMAWRFRPKNAKRAAFYKDYRRFEIGHTAACNPFVSSIGEYHSGVNARKKKKKANEKLDTGFGPSKGTPTTILQVPEVGESVNDSLPAVESESAFRGSRYLIYAGGGDRCKSMDQYLWSFLCSLGEAQYLNRTLVMDLSLCLSSIYSSSGQNEEGKDFRFYFDFEHLKESASVLDQREFWAEWGKWEKKDNLRLHLVEDFRVTPMKLATVDASLIVRKFGDVEPDNYWYRVCEGETEAVIQRPWDKIWKSRRLMEIVSAISTKMGWDFDSVHVVRGEKAKNKELWPNLAADTSAEGLLATLKDKIDDGRKLYVATNEVDVSLFDPLKDRYETHFLDEYRELWAEGSEWDQEMKQLSGGLPVEFDGYMRVEVDTEVFLRGKKQLETFNDLTNDCKDGVNTCKTVA